MQSCVLPATIQNHWHAITNQLTSATAASRGMKAWIHYVGTDADKAWMLQWLSASRGHVNWNQQIQSFHDKKCFKG